jgi:hypothetical protein
MVLNYRRELEIGDDCEKQIPRVASFAQKRNSDLARSGKNGVGFLKPKARSLKPALLFHARAERRVAVFLPIPKQG